MNDFGTNDLVRTLRFLLYVLVLLYVLFDFFPDWINYKYWTISIKIHRTGFFYYYTTLPIIRTGWKISLHLQIYVLVDLKNMGWNIYKTSTYNRNLRVHTYACTRTLRRPVASGGAGGARAPPVFGRSLNPISTMRGWLCPPYYHCTTLHGGDKSSISTMCFWYLSVPIWLRIIILNIIWYNLSKIFGCHSFWSTKRQIL